MADSEQPQEPQQQPQEKEKAAKRELLKSGAECPDVVLHLAGRNQDRRLLEIVRNHLATVVFFFPKAGTPVCTKEVCEFNHAWYELDDNRVAVVGISRDSLERLKAFGEDNNVGYMLASDQDPVGAIAEAFGVRPSGWFGLRPQERATFVIDKSGTVKVAFSSARQHLEHVSVAIQCVRRILSEHSIEIAAEQ